MKIVIDTEAGTLERVGERVDPLLSAESFKTLSDLWVRVGWNQKYSYGFSWFGRPIMQLPEDMIRIQEVIYRVQPDVIIETGIAHGGSLIFYASLMKAIGKGRVVGVDIEIRPHNRAAIEAHPLASMITMIEGSSVDEGIVGQVRAQVKPGETVLVLLDSNHSYGHVKAEIEAYREFVSPGSYMVVTDGVMEYLAGDPRTTADWVWDNPRRAALDFAAGQDAFVLESPAPGHDEHLVDIRTTYWPDAYLRRVK
ncbi:MAG: class I SAM-dependent methyltransferase [Hyphomicrobiaceae bacterium]|nr:class I SAM-dependent methyltransferase [Hyphomicrobiaceae bacterium]